jgi:2,4-dienoyl-CoA reductase-like NADH-dependent reductase (Old Yellow Enzyme family)
MSYLNKPLKTKKIELKNRLVMPLWQLQSQKMTEG